MSDDLLLLSGPVRPPVIPRAPLPPFPSSWGTHYDRPPLASGPPPPSIDYYRGNFCGFRVPGAPSVPGGPAPSNSDLVMACLLDNYPREWQDRFLLQYAEAGYTHLQRSIGHALYYGSSMADYIALSRRAQALGLWCDHWLICNELPGFAFNQDATYWAPILDPLIDQLVGAGVMDLCCVGWQIDQWNQGAPGNPTISIIAHVAKKLPQRIPLYTHWMNEALAWWKTGGEVWSDAYQTINVYDRFTWWQCMNVYLSGGHHQGNTTLARTNPDEYQGRLRDTLNNFHNGRMGVSQRRGGKPFLLDVFECTAQDQFDGNCSELEGDMVGCVLASTKVDGQDICIDGYGNGARMPDGSRF